MYISLLSILHLQTKSQHNLDRLRMQSTSCPRKRIPFIVDARQTYTCYLILVASVCQAQILLLYIIISKPTEPIRPFTLQMVIYSFKFSLTKCYVFREFGCLDFIPFYQFFWYSYIYPGESTITSHHCLKQHLMRST